MFPPDLKSNTHQTDNQTLHRPQQLKDSREGFIWRKRSKAEYSLPFWRTRKGTACVPETCLHFCPVSALTWFFQDTHPRDTSGKFSRHKTLCPAATWPGLKELPCPPAAGRTQHKAEEPGDGRAARPGRAGLDAHCPCLGSLHTHPAGKGEAANDLSGGFAALLHRDLVRLPLVLGHCGHTDGAM